jgi:hypothetical protein
VHTARDTKTIAWCQIRNSNTPTNCPGGEAGVFVPDATPLYTAGEDGLVNTGDDDDNGGVLETSVNPGPDNILGNDDDIHTPLSNYTRQIVISDILLASGRTR